MTSKPTFAELQGRIREIADFHGGVLPRDDAVVWAGYIAALLEWDLIDAGDHGRLQDILGTEAAGPTLAIFLGPEAAKAAAEETPARATTYAAVGV